MFVTGSFLSHSSVDVRQVLSRTRMPIKCWTLCHLLLKDQRGLSVHYTHISHRKPCHCSSIHIGLSHPLSQNEGFLDLRHHLRGRSRHCCPNHRGQEKFSPGGRMHLIAIAGVLPKYTRNFKRFQRIGSFWFGSLW